MPSYLPGSVVTQIKNFSLSHNFQQVGELYKLISITGEYSCRMIPSWKEFNDLQKAETRVEAKKYISKAGIIKGDVQLDFENGRISVVMTFPRKILLPYKGGDENILKLHSQFYAYVSNFIKVIQKKNNEQDKKDRV